MTTLSHAWTTNNTHNSNLSKPVRLGKNGACMDHSKVLWCGIGITAQKLFVAGRHIQSHPRNNFVRSLKWKILLRTFAKLQKPNVMNCNHPRVKINTRSITNRTSLDEDMFSSRALELSRKINFHPCNLWEI